MCVRVRACVFARAHTHTHSGILLNTLFCYPLFHLVYCDHPSLFINNTISDCSILSHRGWAIIYTINPMFLDSSSKTPGKFQCARSQGETQGRSPLSEEFVWPDHLFLAALFALWCSQFPVRVVGELIVGSPWSGRERTGGSPGASSFLLQSGTSKDLCLVPAFLEETGGPVGHAVSSCSPAS